MTGASDAQRSRLGDRPPLQALLWDVDGTLAETERDGHRVAFNEAFAALGLPWRWDVDTYGRLLRITGGRERLHADLAGRADAPADRRERDALVDALHREKNARYAARVRDGGIPLRPGVLDCLMAARSAGWRQAITTTTSRANVEALLGQHLGDDWAGYFDAIVCGEDVAAKKPDPEVFARALDALRLTPDRALAIEDAPAGVTAARAAHVAVIVTRSVYFAQAPVDGARAVGPGLDAREGWWPALPTGGPGAVGIDDLRHWHALGAAG